MAESQAWRILLLFVFGGFFSCFLFFSLFLFLLVGVCPPGWRGPRNTRETRNRACRPSPGERDLVAVVSSLEGLQPHWRSPGCLKLPSGCQFQRRDVGSCSATSDAAPQHSHRLLSRLYLSTRSQAHLGRQSCGLLLATRHQLRCVGRSRGALTVSQFLQFSMSTNTTGRAGRWRQASSNRQGLRQQPPSSHCRARRKLMLPVVGRKRVRPGD